MGESGGKFRCGSGGNPCLQVSRDSPFVHGLVLDVHRLPTPVHGQVFR